MWYLSSEVAAASQLLSPLGACQQFLNFSENYGFIGKKIQSCRSAALLHHSFLCCSPSLSLYCRWSVLVICLWEKQNSDRTDWPFSLSNSGKSILACWICLLNAVARAMLQAGVKADISKLKWSFLLCAFQFFCTHQPLSEELQLLLTWTVWNGMCCAPVSVVDEDFKILAC
jgi:hypothetical protein